MPAKNLTGTDEMWQQAQELANANTEGNVSALIARLGTTLYLNPEAYDLRRPQGTRLRDHFIPKTTGGHVRKNVSMEPAEWHKLQAIANANAAGNKSRVMQFFIPKAYQSPHAFDLVSPSSVVLPEPQFPTVAQQLRHHG